MGLIAYNSQVQDLLIVFFLLDHTLLSMPLFSSEFVYKFRQECIVRKNVGTLLDVVESFLRSKCAMRKNIINFEKIAY